jgi:hypothetical protein
MNSFAASSQDTKKYPAVGFSGRPCEGARGALCVSRAARGSCGTRHLFVWYLCVCTGDIGELYISTIYIYFFIMQSNMDMNTRHKHADTYL